MDANGAIFIPQGIFDFHLAKQACLIHGAKMYAPESKIQRLTTMKWYRKHVAVSSCTVDSQRLTHSVPPKMCRSLGRKFLVRKSLFEG